MRSTSLLYKTAHIENNTTYINATTWVIAFALSCVHFVGDIYCNIHFVQNIDGYVNTTLE